MDFVVDEIDSEKIIQLLDSDDFELLITFRMSGTSRTEKKITERYGWTKSDTVRFKREEGREILRQLFDNMRERRKCLRR